MKVVNFFYWKIPQFNFRKSTLEKVLSTGAREYKFSQAKKRTKIKTFIIFRRDCPFNMRSLILFTYPLFNVNLCRINCVNLQRSEKPITLNEWNRDNVVSAQQSQTEVYQLSLKEHILGIWGVLLCR